MTERVIIPEIEVENRRLGRHVYHDPRSLRYPFRAPTIQLVSKRWSTGDTPVLDQGQLGSCTGNATVGSLLCDNDNPLHSALSDAQKLALNEQLAVTIYSQATRLDDIDSYYPPTDTGSNGLSVAKAAQSMGLISGYSHALSLDDTLAALTTGPVIVGVNWYEGFDNPSETGLIEKTGKVRGGHEVCLDEIDVENKLVWFRNSWSASWGIEGRANMSWDTLGALLSEYGDATILVALTAPAPTPIPVPPTPEPVVDPNTELYNATTDWVQHRKLSRANETLRKALLKWRSTFGSTNN